MDKEKNNKQQKKEEKGEGEEEGDSNICKANEALTLNEIISIKVLELCLQITNIHQVLDICYKSNYQQNKTKTKTTL